MFLFDRFKKQQNTREKTYETFIDSVDDLSQIRLRGIDMSFGLFKIKMENEGFDLTETACYGELIDIKRNQKGFYVDETHALYSEEEYNNYQYGLKVFSKYQEDFDRIHQLLLDKEHIMSGYYKVKKYSAEYLHSMSLDLGYGEIRDKVIYEEDPIHPSNEFNKLAKLLDKVKKSNVQNDKLIKDALEAITPYFKPEYALKEKRIDDKYGLSFDDSFGVIIKNKENGDMHMIYEVDGFDILKDEYDKYLKEKCPYLELYFRIISKCIKADYDEKHAKKAKKY